MHRPMKSLTKGLFITGHCLCARVARSVTILRLVCTWLGVTPDKRVLRGTDIGLLVNGRRGGVLICDFAQELNCGVV